MASMNLPTIDDVRDAARRIEGVAHRTPVLSSSTFDDMVGGRVFFKAENFQRIGAFKFRGAYTALSRLPAAARTRGVVAFSSGNHAQAVALAAALHGAPATIVMPADAPQIKMDATRGYGATVVTYDRYTEDREAIAAELAAGQGLSVIPPFDHVDVISGQGTVGLELIAETGDLDELYVPLGGGGLLSGVALAAREHVGRIVGVEPAAGDDARRSLAQGEIVRIDTPRTIADGAQTQALSPLTFALLGKLADEIETADDESLVEMMRFFAGRMKILVEPTGCLAAAAVLARARAEGGLGGKRIGVVISGGNVDLARFAGFLAGA